MTFDQLLAFARRILTESKRHTTDEVHVATAIVNLLGDELPCGFDGPSSTIAPGLVHIPAQWGGGVVLPLESRAFAASLLRKADEAEKQT